jgi:uncharacterized protein (TIGR02001 family)
MVYRRMIRHRAFCFLCAGLFLLLAHSPAYSKIGIQTNFAYASRYIWRGFDTIANNRPAIQPSYTLNFGKSGFMLNLWSAFALADTDFIELDLIAGYDRSLSDKLTLSTGMGYFTFPSLPHWPDKNSTSPEAYAGISTGSSPLSPALTFYYDFNLGDGFYGTFSLNQNIPIKGKTLTPSFVIGYTTQYRKIGVKRGISDICFGLSMDFISKGVTFTPSVNYVIVPNHTINDENEFWVGFSIGWITGGSTE